MILSGIIEFIFFEIMNGGICGVASFSRWMFPTESTIAGVYFLG